MNSVLNVEFSINTFVFIFHAGGERLWEAPSRPFWLSMSAEYDFISYCVLVYEVQQSEPVVPEL